jgi:signal peptidase I
MAKTRDEREAISSIRETLESIWVAVVLAFVLRAFVLEAFVIPTGSMAPRLMGQHWQFDCPACKYSYDRGDQNAAHEAQCPSCRAPIRFAPSRQWSYGGDRVLVLKYLYRFREPEPWDVVVFKNPLDNQQNYIKRLIGLPGQMIEIIHGDIYYRDGEDLTGDGVINAADFVLDPDATRMPWRILRKSPQTQEVMWQVIYNNDYQPDEQVYRELAKRAWRSPWHKAGGAGWNLGRGGEASEETSRGGRVFRHAAGAGRGTLEFKFARPGPEGPRIDRSRYAPIYAYNRPRDFEEENVSSDLMLSFMFVPTSRDARVGLHLSSFEHHFRAWVSADGKVLVEHGVVPPETAEAAEEFEWDPELIVWDEQPWGERADLEPLDLGRGHDVALMHADHRVTLLIDGRPVWSSTDQQYEADKQALARAAQQYVPTPRILLSAEGGAEIWRLKVSRDVFYTQEKVSPQDRNVNHADLPPGHGVMGNPIVLRKYEDNRDMDEFFVLGDNSPQSHDSRRWAGGSPTLRDREDYKLGTVPRYNMIGKAFFVYWPGGHPLPGLRGVPVIGELGLVPNVGRMRLIR